MRRQHCMRYAKYRYRNVFWKVFVYKKKMSMSSVHILSEKKWNNLLPHFSISSTCNLHVLKYLDIKNRKVKCSIEREACFPFFHIKMFPNMLTNKL